MHLSRKKSRKRTTTKLNFADTFQKTLGKADTYRHIVWLMTASRKHNYKCTRTPLLSTLASSWIFCSIVSAAAISSFNAYPS